MNVMNLMNGLNCLSGLTALNAANEPPASGCGYDFERYVWLAVILIALATAAIRALPFLIFGGKRRPPAWLDRIGRILPPAVIGMLVVYCLRGTDVTSLPSLIPTAVAAFVVIFLHLWRGNTFVSILAGTVTYMVLVQVVFA